MLTAAKQYKLSSFHPRYRYIYSPFNDKNTLRYTSQLKFVKVSEHFEFFYVL